VEIFKGYLTVLYPKGACPQSARAVQRRYGNRYWAESPRAAKLAEIFKQEYALGIANKMPFYRPESEQLQMF
jgi:hypothetical protein